MYKRVFLGVSALALTLAQGTGAAQLPKTTQKALAELKLNASMLEGLDAELAVPKAWLDGAAKEKRSSSWVRVTISNFHHDSGL